jgi:hypothetical protein
MRLAVPRFAVCVLCCMAGSLWWSVATLADAGGESSDARLAPNPSTTAAAEQSPLSGALVVPGTPEEGEQLHAQQEARRLTPAGFAAREASQTAYQHFNGAQAKQLATSAFPNLIEEPAGGPPPLPSGEKIAKYESEYTAKLELPEHKHGVIESVAPIARQTSPGHLACGVRKPDRASVRALWDCLSP